MSAQSLCVSYLKEILQGIHQADDVYKLALFTKDAVLDYDTETYEPDDEVSGQGYQEGGKELEGFSIGSSGKAAWVNFDGPVVWPNSTITARYGLIYNSSRRFNAVAVIDLGTEKISSNGNFRVDLPPSQVGLIRITGP